MSNKVTVEFIKKEQGETIYVGKFWCYKFKVTIDNEILYIKKYEVIDENKKVIDTYMTLDDDPKSETRNYYSMKYWSKEGNYWENLYKKNYGKIRYRVNKIIKNECQF